MRKRYDKGLETLITKVRRGIVRIEETFSWENDRLQVHSQMLNAEKDALSTQISQCET